MAAKEAVARIKINKLLEAAGGHFFAENDEPANIRLESTVTLKKSDLDALGENFEKTSKGFVDFVLLDTKGCPLLVLEAKAEDKNPLIGPAPDHVPVRHAVLHQRHDCRGVEGVGRDRIEIAPLAAQF